MKLILKKNKKSSVSSFAMSIVYDLLFLGIIILFILAFLNNADSASSYFREYYAEDVSLTMTLLEGIPNDMSVKYRVHHTKLLSENDLDLFLEIKDGQVVVSDSNDKDYKTVRNFVTNEDSSFSFSAPLTDIILTKMDSKTQISSELNNICDTFNFKKPYFLDKSIFFSTDDKLLDTIKVKPFFEKLNNTFYNKMESKYREFIPSDKKRRNEYYNLNINTVAYNNAEIVILLRFKKEKNERIEINYFNRGDFVLSKNLGCQIYKRLKYKKDNAKSLEDYGLELNVLPGETSYNNNKALITINIAYDESINLNAADFSQIFIDAILDVTNTDIDEYFDNENG